MLQLIFSFLGVSVKTLDLPGFILPSLILLAAFGKDSISSRDLGEVSVALLVEGIDKRCASNLLIGL